jgi:hypothetical protein
MISTSQKYGILPNNNSIETESVPVLNYAEFCTEMVDLLQRNENHCTAYFAFPHENGLKFFAIVACDSTSRIFVLSHVLPKSGRQELASLTPQITALHIFEREIHENYGITFPGHPWLKPVRYAHNRADKSREIGNYPFYRIESNELHEVGVGPSMPGLSNPAISGSFAMAKMCCTSKFSLAGSTAALNRPCSKSRPCSAEHRGRIDCGRYYRGHTASRLPG